MQQPPSHPADTGSARRSVFLLGVGYCVMPLFWLVLEPHVIRDPQTLASLGILFLGPFFLMASAAFWHRTTRAVSVLLWLGMAHALIVASLLVIMGMFVLVQTWPFLGFTYFIGFAALAYFVAFATLRQWRKRRRAADREST